MTMKHAVPDHHVDEVKLRRAAVSLDLALPWSPPIAHIHREGTRVPDLTDWQVDVLVETLAAAQRLRDPDPAAREDHRKPTGATPPPRKRSSTPEDRLRDALGVNAELRQRIRELETKLHVRDEGDREVDAQQLVDELREEVARLESEIDMEREACVETIREALDEQALACLLHAASRDAGICAGPWSVQTADVQMATLAYARRVGAYIYQILEEAKP